MIKCIIIDDEKPARSLIQLYLSSLAGFEVIASFENSVSAFSFLQKNSVDLIFLDIEMPRVSGMEFIRSLKVCPKVILTTAYREYAVDAFEMDVLDYLVKPITQERFIKAISKYNYYANAITNNSKTMDNYSDAYIFFRINREEIKVFLKDILYIEGFKDYIKIHTTNKVLMANERLSYLEERLPESKFVRTHKSYIVAVDKISQYKSEQISIAGNILPIGRVYKQFFIKKIEKK